MSTPAPPGLASAPPGIVLPPGLSYPAASSFHAPDAALQYQQPQQSHAQPQQNAHALAAAAFLAQGGSAGSPAAGNTADFNLNDFQHSNPFGVSAGGLGLGMGGGLGAQSIGLNVTGAGAGAGRGQICNAFQQGMCRYGNTCKFLHVAAPNAGRSAWGAQGLQQPQLQQQQHQQHQQQAAAPSPKPGEHHLDSSSVGHFNPKAPAFVPSGQAAAANTPAAPVQANNGSAPAPQPAVAQDNASQQALLLKALIGQNPSLSSLASNPSAMDALVLQLSKAMAPHANHHTHLPPATPNPDINNEFMAAQAQLTSMALGTQRNSHANVLGFGGQNLHHHQQNHHVNPSPNGNGLSHGSSNGLGGGLTGPSNNNNFGGLGGGFGNRGNNNFNHHQHNNNNNMHHLHNNNNNNNNNRYHPGGGGTAGNNLSSSSQPLHPHYLPVQSFGFGGGPSTSSLGMVQQMKFFSDPAARDARREQELFGGTTMTTGINFDRYDDIPVEVTGNDVPGTMNAFADFDFPDAIKQNIELSKYVKPTPIQKHALPVAFMGRDLMACAQTGSGKTAAFLVPFISFLVINGRPAPLQSGRGVNRRYMPVGLILAPTRELATQIWEESLKFTYCTSIHSVVVYGGQDIRQQFRELDRGCDVLVATPGRLMDFIERGRISLAQISYLCLDEADRMLDMGFEPQIRNIVMQQDMSENRQTLMFSATFPKEIQRLAQDFLYNYIFIAIGRVGASCDFITQNVEWVEEENKRTQLMALLPKCKGLTLIFVERKKSADLLETFLNREGYHVTSIHGDRSQSERENALAMFRAGRVSVLVATDVAARGLDIPGIDTVINFDMSNSIEDYTHRIGRTGRAGNTGNSFTFMNEKSNHLFKDLYEMLHENKQIVPQWLSQVVESRMGMRGGGGGGNRKFASKDYRSKGGYGSHTGGRGGMASHNLGKRFIQQHGNHQNHHHANQHNNAGHHAAASTAASASSGFSSGFNTGGGLFSTPGASPFGGMNRPPSAASHSSHGGPAGGAQGGSQGFNMPGAMSARTFPQAAANPAAGAFGNMGH